MLRRFLSDQGNPVQRVQQIKNGIQSALDDSRRCITNQYSNLRVSVPDLDRLIRLVDSLDEMFMRQFKYQDNSFIASDRNLVNNLEELLQMCVDNRNNLCRHSVWKASYQLSKPRRSRRRSKAKSRRSRRSRRRSKAKSRRSRRRSKAKSRRSRR